MSARIVYGILLALLLAACSSSPPAPTALPAEAGAQEKNILQVKNGEIVVDGDLSEWAPREWLAVDRIPEGQPPPSSDLDVKASIGFDTQKLYLAVRALDDDIQEDEGDKPIGFILVTDEGKNSSTYAYFFSFTQENQSLVLRNGEIAPPFDTQDIQFRSRQYDGRQDCEVAIPFKLLKPFNPFIYKKVALNLVYAYEVGEQTRTIMLFPDRALLSEYFTERAGMFFNLKTSAPQSAQEVSFNAAMKKNFWKDGDVIELRYAVHAGEGQENIKIRAALLSQGDEKQRVVKKLALKPGLNEGAFPLKIGCLPSGNYTLLVTFLDRHGQWLSQTAEDVFILNRKEIEKVRQRAVSYETQKTPEPSLSNLEIRFEWLDKFYEKSQYEELSALSTWWDDIQFLLSRLEKGEPAVFDPGGIQRYAIRSSDDNTLQPYTVFLPETFNPDKPYPLIVFLHGSGADDQSAWGELELLELDESLFALGLPVIAPKARGPSSGYLTVAGQDVFDCIEHFLGLYPNIRRERVFLIGHSMGGIGGWRLGVLRPETFRGLVILAGPMEPGVLSQFEKLRNQNIFIVHGVKDSQVPVRDSILAVEKLTDLGANFEYIELPEAGHLLEQAPWPELMAWIKKYSE